MINRLIYSVLLLSVLIFSSCDLFNSSDREVQWVIGVYAVADNNLESQILEDVTEMTEAALGSSRGQYIQVFVLLDRWKGNSGGDFTDSWTDTRLYEIEYTSSGSTLVEKESTDLGLTISDTTEELDMSDPVNLENFTDWFLAQSEAPNSMLIIGSHADSWYPASGSVAVSDSTRGSGEFAISQSIASDGGGTDSYGSFMGIDEMADALDGKGLGIIVADACNVGNLETIYELRNSCSWFTGSPETIQGDGQNYTLLFEKIQESRFTVSGTALAVAEAYKLQYGTYLSDYEQVMAYDTRAVSEIIENTGSGSFQEWVTGLQSETYSEIKTARTGAEDYFVSPDNSHRDLLEFLESRNETGLISSFQSAIQSPSGKTDVLSIWFPDNYSSHTRKDDYEAHLEFPGATPWNEFLTWYDAQE